SFDSSGDFIAFRNRMFEWFKRRGAVCRFVWVREAHASGRPHYHVMVWLPRSLRLPAADACGWWPHGFSNTQVVHSGAAYMAKYVSKAGHLNSPAFPKGCRIHGSGGLSVRSRWDRRWFLSPRWVRESLGAGSDP
ncbi:replication initiation protein, partial [mine drainage metagenome]